MLYLIVKKMKHTTTIILILIFLPFILYAQRYVISSARQNILYAGIENPLDICVENYNCNSIFIKSNKGRLSSNGGGLCRYLFWTHSDSIGIVRFQINGIKKKDTICLGYNEFKIKRFPKPIPKIAGMKSGFIQKDLLISFKRIDVVFEDFDIEIKSLITRFSVKINKKEEIVYVKDFVGGNLSAELKNEFSKLDSGDEICFFNINFEYPNKKVDVLEQINFIIK